MSFFMVTGANGVQHLRQAQRLDKVTDRAAAEFASGVASITLMTPAELASWQASGRPLPATARTIVERWKATVRAADAVQRRVDAVRQRARAQVQKAREEARALVATERQRMKDEAIKASRREAAREKREAEKAVRLHCQEAVQHAQPTALPDGNWQPEVAPWD